MKKKISMLLSGVLLTTMLFSGCGKKEPEVQEKKEISSYEEIETSIEINKENSLTVWCYEEDDFYYLSEAAKTFYSRYGVAVTVEQRNPTDFLQQVNNAVVEKKGPDLYLTTNDQLKIAYEAGLAQNNTIFSDTYWERYFPEVTKKALTVGEKTIGFPLYLDTYFLFYDKTVVSEKPTTLDDVLNFADTFADEGNEREIFNFDVSDPYYSFMFMGNYGNFFGENGDNYEEFPVNSADTINSMSYYQAFGEFLSVEYENSNEEVVLEGLMEEKLIFAIGNTKMYEKIKEGMEETKNNYAITMLPDLNDTLKSKGISTTTTVLVSPYSKYQQEAELFGAYLACEYVEAQYSLNGKISPCKMVEYTDTDLNCIIAQYEKTLPAPKVLAVGDFWSQAQIHFQKIWEGEDVATELNEFQTSIESRQ